MNKFQINITNQYHILRHFNYVDNQYIKNLIGKEYYYYSHNLQSFRGAEIDLKSIEDALKTKGSKFLKNIKLLETPRKLLILIKNEWDLLREKEITWQTNSLGRSFSFIINYSEAVGYKDLISIEDLTSAERKRINTFPRSNHEGEKSVLIKTISGVEKKLINTIEVGILDTMELPFYLITAYPGDLMPTLDFSHENQLQLEHDLSLDYWNTHVFIE